MVYLVGSTVFDLDSLSATAYEVGQIAVTKSADLHYAVLSEHERLILALYELRGGCFLGDASSILRLERQALRFLNYQFMVEAGPFFCATLQSYCLDYIPCGDKMALVQGRLSDWLDAIYHGTNGIRLEEVKPYCEIFLYLESVVGLQNVMSRFYRDAKEVEGQNLFSLRYQ